MSTNYTFENDPNIEKFYLKDGEVFDSQGKKVPASVTKGINLAIRKKSFDYNASLISRITGTPIHFWQQASQPKKDIIMKIIEPDLKVLEQKLANYREEELKKVYNKRSRRAINSRKNKILDTKKQ